MGLTERQEELVSGLVDNVLQGEELREAEQLVASEPEAARLLADYRDDMARLKALPVMKAEPRHRARLKFPSRRPMWLLRAAAVLLLVLGVAWWVLANRPLQRLVARMEARVHPGEHKLVQLFPGLRGKLVAEAVTHFKARIDGADGHASEAHLLLSYDFDGDGKFDRVETYELATDAQQGWQEVTDSTSRLIKTEGLELRDFMDGAVKAELRCTHPENALLAQALEITLPVGE